MSRRLTRVTVAQRRASVCLPFLLTFIITLCFFELASASSSDSGSTAVLTRYSDGYCSARARLRPPEVVLLNTCLNDPSNLAAGSLKVACSSSATFNAQVFVDGTCSGLPDVNVTNGLGGSSCFYASDAFSFQLDCTPGT